MSQTISTTVNERKFGCSHMLLSFITVVLIPIILMGIDLYMMVRQNSKGCEAVIFVLAVNMSADIMLLLSILGYSMVLSIISIFIYNEDENEIDTAEPVMDNLNKYEKVIYFLMIWSGIMAKINVLVILYWVALFANTNDESGAECTHTLIYWYSVVRIGSIYVFYIMYILYYLYAHTKISLITCCKRKYSGMQIEMPSKGGNSYGVV